MECFDFNRNWRYREENGSWVGVIHQHIDPSVSLDGKLRHGLALCLLPHICDNIFCLPTLARIASTFAFRRSSRLAARTTFAPIEAALTVVAAPKPEDAPVTILLRSVS